MPDYTGRKVDFGGTGQGGEWLTVNVDPGIAHDPPDLVADITASAGELTAHLAPQSIAAARCLHTLEHLPPIDVVRNLTYWRSFMQPGAVLRVVVPDVERIAEMYVNGAIPASVFVGMIYVPPEWQAKGEGEGHRWGFDQGLLHDALTEAGFTDVIRLNVPITHYVDGYPVPNLCMEGKA